MRPTPARRGQRAGHLVRGERHDAAGGGRKLGGEPEVDAGEWPALVAGPPPIADDQHNRRTAALNDAFSAACADHGTPYVDVFEPLRDNKVWMHEVETGDGAHPAAEGYAAYADLVYPQWTKWLDGLIPR